MSALTAPFPYAGGKRAVAPLVWSMFGTIDHYREPFCGSAAVLLSAPQVATTEIINDLSGHITNVWRAIRTRPVEVAAIADDWINEIDLFARHVALVNAEPALSEQLMSDPDYCDPRLAAWWIWGASQWIGSDWATGRGSWTVVDGKIVKGRGAARKAPAMGVAVGREHGMKGVHKQMPTMSADPSNPYGQPRGVHGVRAQMPMVAAQGTGHPNTFGVNGATAPLLSAWIGALSERLRSVRALCGDWERILTDAVCWNYKGVKGIFLDPPYPGTDNSFYHADNADVWHAAQSWAIQHGERADARICLAGLDDQKMPATWHRRTWSRNGGYGNQSDGAGRANAAREVLWFSPHCGALADLPMWQSTL